MIVICQNCSSSLQIDETKATTERFSIRCPKCQTPIPVNLKNGGNNTFNPTNPQKSGGEISAPPSPPARDWSAPTAVPYRKPAKEKTPETVAPATVNADLLSLIAALQQSQTTTKSGGLAVGVPKKRRALVCLNAEKREATAGLLDDAGFTVYLAENPAQATEKIRDEDVDIVIYSADFALKFGGSNVLQQMINSLMAPERRRLFVVSIEEGSATYSTHEAFLRNLNLIVNVSDLHHLPSILTRALKDYDELYFNYLQAAKK